jgi:dihydroxy-acid dehydratase
MVEVPRTHIAIPAAGGVALRPPTRSARAVDREGGRSLEVLTRRTSRTIAAAGAIGGSTNAVVHLLAIAGRMGVDPRSTTGTGSGAMPRLVNPMLSGDT